MVTQEDDAFEQELKAAPWAYGQKREPSVYEILNKMRAHGLIVEADIIARLLAGKT